MSMLFDIAGTEWTQITEAEEQKALLDKLIQALSGTPYADFVGDRRSDIKHVRERALKCYPGYRLLDFRINPQNLPLSEYAQRVRLYALLKDDHAVVFDGKSRAIHEFNAFLSETDGETPLYLE